MGGKIFLNYRRDENAERALAIASYLERKFGSSRVFIDIDSLRAGQNFPDELEKRLAACDVMLTLIGPSWLGARNEAGTRRLDDPQDWVRLEIERALARKIIVIPVLTGGASLPKAVDLPKSLKPLIQRQAAVVTTKTFRTDMAGLASDMRELMPGPKWGLIGAAAGALALAGAVVVTVGPKLNSSTPSEPVAEIKEAQAEVGRRAAQAAEGRKRAEEAERKAAQEAAEKQMAAEAELRAAQERLRIQVTELAATGESYIIDHDYDRAIADYTKAIEIDPKFADAYYNRGLAYCYKQDYDRAITDYTKAIEIDPKFAIASAIAATFTTISKITTGPSRTTPRPTKSIPNMPRPTSIAATFTIISKITSGPSRTIPRPSKSIPTMPRPTTIAATLTPISKITSGPSRTIPRPSKSIPTMPRPLAAKQEYDRAIADYTKPSKSIPNMPLPIIIAATLTPISKNTTGPSWTTPKPSKSIPNMPLPTTIAA